MRKNDPTAKGGAFTLLELICVMALLAAILAFSAPSLARSLRERHLEDEAARFLALTEYARNEAISRGIPMTIWLEPETGRFAATPADGFDDGAARGREYTLGGEIQMEVVAGVNARAEASAIIFGPEGTLDPQSVESVRMRDRFNSALRIDRTEDSWGYEIVKETP
jgi:type II secretion system protein H